MGRVLVILGCGLLLICALALVGYPELVRVALDEVNGVRDLEQEGIERLEAKRLALNDDQPDEEPADKDPADEDTVEDIARRLRNTEDLSRLKPAELAARIKLETERLTSQDAAVRLAASEGLYNLCDQWEQQASSAIPGLIRGLGDANPKVVDNVQHALEQCGRPAIDPLSEALSHAEPQVRARAARVLVSIAWRKTDGVQNDQPHPLTPRFRELLTDEDERVRAAGANGVASLRDGSADTLRLLSEMLVAKAASDREAACRAFDTLCSEYEDDLAFVAPCRDQIVRATSDPADDVRDAALGAVRKLRLPPAEALPIFVRGLEDDSELVLREAISGVEDLVKAGVDASAAVPGLIAAVNKLNSWQGRSAIATLGKIGPQAKAAVPLLLKTLDSKSTLLACEAAEALWLINRQVDPLLPLLKRLLEDPLSGGDGECACDVVAAIGPAAGSLTPLLIRALQEEDWDLQWAAADALGAVKSTDPAAVAALVKTLGHPSGRVIGGAARGLVGMDPALTVPALTKALESRESQQVEWAADVLGMLKDKAAPALEKLRPLINHKQKSVRQWAAIALGEIAGDAAGLPILIEALGGDEDNLRERACAALARIGPAGRAALDALQAALADTNDETLRRSLTAAIESVLK